MDASSASPVLRYTTTVAVIVVGLIAAVVSYSHMVSLGIRVGEDWRSYLIPFSIDGLMVAASMVLVTRRRAGLPASGLAWGALGVGVLASLATNMADATGSMTAILYAGWAPVALAVGFELLLLQRRAETPAQDQNPRENAPAVVAVPVVEAVRAPADTPAVSPFGGLLEISEGKPSRPHIEEGPKVQRPLAPAARPITQTPLRLVSRPAGRSPVRDRAVRWLVAQQRRGVDLADITPGDLAKGIGGKVDTCRRNLDTWRTEAAQGKEVAI
jgi:hypothetical protein